MKHVTPWLWLALALCAPAHRFEAAEGRPAEPGRRLVTIDPGHFHAALMQKEMLPGISDRAGVYAPLGPDLLAHLARVARFNQRAEQPTHWAVDIHAADDFWARALREPPGSLAVLSGRNRGKIDRIAELVEHGFHVLADKPWVIEPAEFPKVATTLARGRERGVIAYDAMTQRFEITCLLQRELVNLAGVFGAPLAGTPEQPGVALRSSHALLKEVAGAANPRPGWFFDIREQGEGLADVGTHLVDLIPWILFPEQAIDFRSDISVLDARRWPTFLDLNQFRRVTGEPGFPESLRPVLEDGRLAYFANNRVDYLLRGVHCRVEVVWHFQASPATPETSSAVFRGNRSRVEVLQEGPGQPLPELYVVPNRKDLQPAVRDAPGGMDRRAPGALSRSRRRTAGRSLPRGPAGAASHRA